jgi:RNA polymerase sigma factor (sigma-70 family)
MDSEELTNEVMIRVHKNLAKFDEEKSQLKTWIYNIATNCAIDFIRKKRLNTLSLDQVHFDWRYNDEEGNIDQLIALKSTEDNPEEKMISDEVKRTLYAQINTLSKTDQEIVSRHFFDGLSYEEVANELGMPLGTLKARIHKARVVLMEAFPTFKK